MKSIAAIILAAGSSTRLGTCKQLIDWSGVPLLAHVADVTVDAGFEPVIIVLGCQAEEIRRTLGRRPVRTVMNWRWEEGMSTSVQIGLAALPPETEAALFLQCDQPLITVDLLRALAARFQETGAPIVHPTYAGQRGTPVLFARRLFRELAAVSGDEGGRSLINHYAKDAATISIDDPDVLADIDTTEDYERLRRKVSSPKLHVGHSEPETTDRCPESVLAEIHNLIIDMDGVLWRGSEPMSGLHVFFDFLRQRNIGFMLATNNSSKTPEQYAAKMARFDVDVPTECVLTSALVSAAYLAEVAPAKSRVYVIGEEGLERALEERGFVLTNERASYVVVGWDRQLTWDKLATAALLIHAGAKLVGTNPDKSYPTERGPVPGNGAQLAALEATTGVTPIVTGKPEQRMYKEALRRMDARPETTAMIGDRLDTDIAGAARVGLSTILVLSGIADESDLNGSAVRPDLVCADIGELAQLWKAALE